MTEKPNKYNTNKDISDRFKECYEIFKKKLFDRTGTPNAHKLNQAFLRKIKDVRDCFGSSIIDSTLLITNYLRKYQSFRDIENDFSSYLFLQNLLVDRMETILDLVKISREYREKEFEVFHKISAWTYFLKPNSAFITKYPVQYVFEKDKTWQEGDQQDTFIIDALFVENYYNDKSNDENYLTTLKKMGFDFEQVNNKNICLIIPNMADITEQFCTAVNKFIDLFVNETRYVDAYSETV